MNGKVHRCETCGFRRYAEKHPNSLIGRFWKWHTGWCPGWKKYVRETGGPEVRPPEDHRPA